MLVGGLTYCNTAIRIPAEEASRSFVAVSFACCCRMEMKEFLQFIQVVSFRCLVEIDGFDTFIVENKHRSRS